MCILQGSKTCPASFAISKTSIIVFSSLSCGKVDRPKTNKAEVVKEQTHIVFFVIVILDSIKTLTRQISLDKAI